MNLLPLQLVCVATVAVFLGRWIIAERRRNSQSWESLVARLRPDWNTREVSDRFDWEGTIVETPEDIWQLMKGPRGLLAMFHNAKVMLDMADYADRNGVGVDRALLDYLRMDARTIRVCALRALLQYAFTFARESVYDRAFQAATLYLSMATRMTDLLLGAGLVREFMAT